MEQSDVVKWIERYADNIDFVKANSGSRKVALTYHTDEGDSKIVVSNSIQDAVEIAAGVR